MGIEDKLGISVPEDEKKDEGVWEANPFVDEDNQATSLQLKALPKDLFKQAMAEAAKVEEGGGKSKWWKRKKK